MGEVSVNVPRLRRIAGRYYWRPTPAIKRLGFRMVALGADLVKAIDTAQRLNAQVERQLAGVAEGPRDGTVAALLLAYEREDHFATLRPNTRKQYLGIMREIAKNAGDLAVAGITRKDMKALYRALVPRGLAVAAAHMRFWRVLLGYAMDEGWRPDNPATSLGIKAPRARTQTWTVEEIELLCATAEGMGKSSIALAVRLAYETSQRVSDVLRATWRDVEGGVLRVEQMKTRTKVAVPLSDKMIADLERVPRTALTVITSDATGRPWSDVNFRAHFNAVRAKAGLRHLRFHDLRRTALTEAGSAGATVHELLALGGHADVSSLSAYVLPTRQAAQSAQDKRGTRWKTAAAKVAKSEDS